MASSLLNLTGGYAPGNPSIANTPKVAPTAPDGVYWQGSDGNFYTKVAGQNGVKNVGTNKAAISGLRQQADPLAKPTVATTTPAGGGSGTTFDDRSNDITQQNAGLNTVDTQVSSGQAAVDAALNALRGKYDTESAAEKTSFGQNSDQNRVNLTKNQQTALVNAAQGRQGLNGTLSSLGALNGSGVELATRAVQRGANEDLAGATDNFATNAQALGTADAAFQLQDKERRDQAAADAETAKTKVKSNGLQTRLGYYQNLSNDYAAQGDKANAAKYTGLASSLFPEIAATTVPDAAPTYTPAAYTSPSLASYLNGGNTQVNVTPPGAAGGIPGLSSSTIKKKALVTA